MFRTRLIGCNERQIDIRFHHGRQLTFGLLGGLFEPLKRHPILAQIDSLVLSKFIGQIIDYALVEIFATEEGVAIGRLDLEDAFAQFED